VDWLLASVDIPQNGLTFCAGSLSSGLHNDVPALATRYASRTHFIHLRSTEVFDNKNFAESNHLSGPGTLAEVTDLPAGGRTQKQEDSAVIQSPCGPITVLSMLSDIDNNIYNPG
jgi:D-mannonate dehydratase